MNLLKCASAIILLVTSSSARISDLPGFPRDANGHLQAFDCGQIFPHKPHRCDPLIFSKIARAAKTVAVTVRSSPFEDLEPARKRVESLVRQWKLYRVISDPESADIVFQLVQFRIPSQSSPEDKPAAEVLVWPQGANPETDDVLWFEYSFGKWTNSDTVASAIKLLHSDIKDARKVGP